MSIDMNRPSSDEQAGTRIITDELRLTPVVELEPGQYGSAPQPSSSPWTAAESDSYWRACFRAGGLTAVDPIVPGSWLVRLDDLKSSELLLRVLQVHFADGVPTEPDEIGALSGGFALCDGGEVLVLPTCCGDLGDLSNWQKVARQRTESPEMLWIGHPWLSAWYEASMLHIREETEYGPPVHSKIFAMAPATLQHAVQLAEQELDLFCERVVGSLRNLPGVLDARATARILLGRRDS